MFFVKEANGPQNKLSWLLYLSLHCHHQNDSCIRMGSDESHFNVSVIVRDKVARRCPETAAFWKECRAEADSNRDPSGYGYFFINTPRLGGLHDIKVSLIMYKNLCTRNFLTVSLASMFLLNLTNRPGESLCHMTRKIASSARVIRVATGITQKWQL